MNAHVIHEAERSCKLETQETIWCNSSQKSEAVRSKEANDISLSSRAGMLMYQVKQASKRRGESSLPPFFLFCFTYALSGLDGAHPGEDNLLNSLTQMLILQLHPVMIFNSDTLWPSQVDMRN